MKYRKKPLIVDAWPWPESPDGVGDWGASGQFIETLEGISMRQKGDWLVQGIMGEFYPCKPDVFAMTYDPVEET